MASRVFWRRSATAAWVYAAVVFGILGTVVAARVLGLEDFGAVRHRARRDRLLPGLPRPDRGGAADEVRLPVRGRGGVGKLRRLFARALQLKIAGGVLASLALVALAPVADELFGAEGLTVPLLVGALLPLVQAPENIGATALLLHGRYDLRGAYGALSMLLRLSAIVIAAPYGVTETIAAMVVAQAVAVAVLSIVGVRRAPPPAGRAAAAARRGPAARFSPSSSSRASAPASSRCGRRSSRSCSASSRGRRRSASSASRRRR